MGKKEEQEMHRDERIEQTGQLTLTDNKEETSIHLLTIIGEIEGHDNLGSSSKTTKYEHILPQLAAIEDSKNISGLLVLLNTMGGDVEVEHEPLSTTVTVRVPIPAGRSRIAYDDEQSIR